MYHLFAGVNYYPNGGPGDFIQSFESVEAATEHYEKNYKEHGWDWCNITDTTMKIKAETYNKFGATVDWDNHA